MAGFQPDTISQQILGAQPGHRGSICRLNLRHRYLLLSAPAANAISRNDHPAIGMLSELPYADWPSTNSTEKEML